MQQLFGSYATGQVPVFRGTASASDSIAAEPSAELSFTDQTVIAVLAVRVADPGDFPNASGNAAVLTIHVPVTGDYVVLEQTGGTTTHIGTVRTSNQSGSQWESCDNCVPDLMNKPATISIASVTATGTAGSGGDVLQTTVSAPLGVVAPNTLTFDDMLTLGFPDPLAGPLVVPGPWMTEGSEEVATATGTLFTAGDLVGQCAMFTPFTVLVYVNTANLREFGARDYVEGSPHSQCGP